MTTRIEWMWSSAVPGYGTAGNIESIEFDASVRETPRVAATVTTHPIESGASPADHIRAEPRTVQIEGVISDAPVREPETQMDGAASEQRDGVLQFIGEFDRVRSVRDLLTAIVEAGVLVTIRSGFAVYEGFALTSFEVRREGPDGALHFTLDATQIRIVETEVVEAPREVRARRRRDRGAQSPVPVTGESADNRSFAAHAEDDSRDWYQGTSGGGIEGSGW